jgi:hypothetical protein
LGWNGTKDFVIPKREQPGAAVSLYMTRLCVGYAERPSLPTCAQLLGEPAGRPWTFPAGHWYGES